MTKEKKHILEQIKEHKADSKKSNKQIKETEEELRQKLFALQYQKNPPSIKDLFGAESIGKFFEILKKENLFEILNIEFDKTIVHEEDTRKTILLIALGGRLVKNTEPTSNNLLVNDQSGAGKDYIVKQVLKLIPEEDTIIRKRISEKAFTYWHNAKFEPDWTWNGKTFYNEDISNPVLNSDVFKVMSSSDGVNKSTIIINNMPFDIITNGKPSMILTIASASPKQELLRRYPICNLNTTEEQTKLILKRKAEFHIKGIKPEYDTKIKKSLEYLKRINVKVPFADKLINVLNTRHIIIRTHFDRFIDYIKFSTALHQFQREQDKEGYYLATDQDYEIGRIALIKTTSNIFSIPLTKNQQRILDIMKQLDRNLNYSVTDLEAKVTFISDRMLRIELDKLTEYGFLHKDKEERAESRKPVMVYSILDTIKINIPTWKDIQNISDVSSVSFNSNVSNVSNDGTNERNETNAGKTHETEMQKTSKIEVEEVKDG